MRRHFRFGWRGTVLVLILYTCAALYAAESVNRFFSPFRFHIH